MIWMLAIILIGKGNAVTVTPPQFKTEASCKAAGEKVLAPHHWGAAISYVCISADKP